MSGCGKGRGNGTLYRCKLKNSNNELKFISIMRWFNKNELIRCYRQDKAQRCKECRLPQPVTRLPNGIEESLAALVEDVLDPVREKLGRPIVVNSGFRCPVHNRMVGGATGSQHVKGEAADDCSEWDVGPVDIVPDFCSRQLQAGWWKSAGNSEEDLRRLCKNEY